MVRDPFEALLQFDDVVDELLVSFRSTSDWPAGHRCTKPLGYDPALGYEPPNLCTHAQFSTKPLLARLEELVEPGSSLVPPSDKDRRPTRRPGSPAPWAAGPAELLDEILLGALSFNTSMRQLMDLPELEVTRQVWRRRIDPRWHAPLSLFYGPVEEKVTQKASVIPRHDAGRAALADLPRLLGRFQRECPDHPAAHGPYIDTDDPKRGRRWGKVESTVRAWRRRARLLTGHTVDERTVVHRLPNPHSGKRWPWPVCRETPDCGHDSCWRIWLTHAKPLVPLRCPRCSTLGLVQDDITGAMFCDRPSCRDENGARHEWSLDAIFQMLSLDGGELG